MSDIRPTQQSVDTQQPQFSLRGSAHGQSFVPGWPGADAPPAVGPWLRAEGQNDVDGAW